MVGLFYVIEMIDVYYKLYLYMYLLVVFGNLEIVLCDFDEYVCDVGVVVCVFEDVCYFM